MRRVFLFLLVSCLSAIAVDYETVQLEEGKNLRYRKTDNGYLLVLVPGQEIMQSLAAFQKAMGFKLGSAIGIGDVEKTEITHFDTKKKGMEKSPIIVESHEMTSLTCTMSMIDGKTPIPHCHINLGLSKKD